MAPSATVHSRPSTRTIPHPAGSTEDVRPNDSYTALENANYYYNLFVVTVLTHPTFNNTVRRIRDDRLLTVAARSFMAHKRHLISPEIFV